MWNFSEKAKMTSDDFFLQNKKMFDIVFIDGLHIEEQVEKDIKNSLAILAANGTIVVHDCNPPTEWHQRGEYDYGKWNGTVWRGYVKYRKRPDLSMCVIDEDWGIGIIQRGKQEPLDLEEVTYDLLEKNRKTWLNLVSFNDFKKL